MTAMLPFERALRDELVAAAEREQRRPHRRRVRTVVGSALAAAAAGIAATVAVLAPTTASAAVEIETNDGEVQVRIEEGRTDREELLDALRGEGLRAIVEEVPTGPSNVGRFVGVAIEGPDAGAVEVDIDAGRAADAFVVPEHWDGALHIYLGRAARDGERYDATTDAFAEGEPLHCSGLYGRSLERAADELPDRLTVEVLPLDEGLAGSQQLPLAHAARELGDWIVFAANAISADELLLLASPSLPPPVPVVPPAPSEQGC